MEHNNNNHPKKEKFITINFSATKLKPTTVISIILVALIIVSGIQTYELLKIKNAGAAISPIQKSTNASSSQAPLPSSLQDLPDMVGGC